MAKKPGSKSAAQLREQIDQSREDVEHRLARVREESDIPKKVRRSVQREPVPWIIGAVAVGLLITAAVTRRRKVVVSTRHGSSAKGPRILEAGFLLGALRVAATLLKPVVVKLVEDKFGHFGRARSETKHF